VPERVAVCGLSVQPAFLRGVVRREDSRAAFLVAGAPPRGARTGLVAVLGWADQRIAPPAPSRHAIAPFRPLDNGDSVGRESGGADDATGPSLDAESSGVAREAHHSRFTSRSCGRPLQSVIACVTAATPRPDERSAASWSGRSGARPCRSGREPSGLSAGVRPRCHRRHAPRYERPFRARFDRRWTRP